MKNKLSVWKFIYIASLFLIIGFYSPVYAKDTIKSTSICLSNHNLYSITWDTSVNSLVSESAVKNLTQANIESSYVPYPAGTTELDKEKYKINAVLVSTNCHNESDGSYYTCPTNEEKSNYDTSRLLQLDENDSTKYKNIIEEFNISNGTFTIKIKDIFNGKAKLRYVSSESLVNEDGKNTSTSYNTFASKEGNYFVLRNIKPSTSYQKSNGTWEINPSKIIMEFYIDNPSSKCHTFYIGSSEFIVSTVNENLEVNNPALTDDSYGCQNVKKYINNLTKAGVISNDSDIIDTVKNEFAYLCYDKKIKYSDYVSLKSKIEQQFNDLQNLMGYSVNSPISTINVSGNITCEKNYSTNSRVVLAKSGSWWNLSCTEKYEAQGDKAKLVYAGDGFSYVSTFKAVRTCTLQQKATVKLKPQCRYNCETICTWTESTGVKVGNHAGPSEDFDSCVNKCDGGKYTQDCINSCYQQVYGIENDRKLPTLDNKEQSKDISFLKDNYKIERMENEGTIIGIITSAAGGTFTGDYSPNGYPRFKVDIPTPHCGNVGVTFSTYCETTGGGVCIIYETKGPGGCVDEPYAIYQQEINSSASEFNSMITLMQSDINTGTYNIQIDDSYLNNDGIAYRYEISSLENPNIVTTQDGGGYCNSATWTAGSLGEQFGFCSQNQTSKIVTVKLPAAYLDKVTGSAIYETGVKKYKKFNTSTATNKLEPVAFNRNGWYYAGERYYTNVLSNNTNVVLGKDKVSLISYNKYFSTPVKKAGIAVKVSGFGTNRGFSNQINCFYGVYNDTFCRKDDDCPSDDLGIQFIFRPIDLTDVFPNERSGRWNWTNKASTINTDKVTYSNDSKLNYKIKPEVLTEVTEDKGYTVYNDSNELDYEIILTPEKIKNIRRYNKSVEDINKDGSRNYLDYNMTCGTKNNREVCYSNFLDNTNYVTYGNNFNSSTRKDIAICNNAYSQKCTE